MSFQFKKCVFLLLSCLTLVSSLSGAESSLNTTELTPLRVLADNKNFKIGVATNAWHMYSNNPADTLYKEVVGREFNIMVAESEMKMSEQLPARGHYNFTQGDKLAAFAQAHNMSLRGHTLVWHQALPKWLRETKLSKQELTEILHDYIFTVITHYKEKFPGVVKYWDVVNEAFDDTPETKLRDTIWRQALGDNYLEIVYQWAHEADPDAVLFYNDYGFVYSYGKANRIHAEISRLLAKNVPIHGVGMQMHISAAWQYNYDLMAQNVDKFAALGLEVQFTEMDVRINDDVQGKSDAKFALQAEAYKNYIKLCLAREKCTAILFWGVTDKYTWVGKYSPWLPQKIDWPLILDEHYQGKPAYYAIQETLS